MYYPQKLAINYRLHLKKQAIRHVSPQKIRPLTTYYLKET